MDKQWISHRTLKDRLQGLATTCGAGVGAAALAIGVALVAMTTVILALGALGVNSAPESLTAAVQDAAVSLYAVQLVGLSFFNDTAELRFAAVPGLLLVGLAIVAATAVAARATRGSARRKMTVALATSIPYALLMGLAALFAPLHFTAPGFAADVAISPAPVEAFLLPLAWGSLFASIGGLIGVFGKGWRSAASRQLGAWSDPLSSSLRALTVGLAASAAVALVAGLEVTGWDLSAVVDGGFGHALKVVAGALVALPTLAAAVFVAGFGVPFDWQVDVLSQGQGSFSAFGGALPSSGADISGGQGAPGALALAPVIVLATVFAIGWLSARRSGSNPRLLLANAVRAAVLFTAVVWVLALLARVDAQVGGLLGFHLVPDAGALLWRVPLVALAGCLAGSVAYVLARGAFARRRLAAGMLAAARPSNWGLGSRRPSRPEWVSEGLTWRAALGVSFAAVPVLLVGMGATGTPTSAAPEDVSMAPIVREAEQVLEGDSNKDEAVAVTVNPETRAVDTASVSTPLRALEIAPGQSRPAKAKDVLGEYGELFGLADPAAELGNAEATTDKFGVTHVSFGQMANGLPVYGGGVSVHLSQKGELLEFVAASVIPDVSLEDEKAKLSSAEAAAVAKEALPSGTLAEAPALQVYAGMTPYVSGPNARLAWFVWLIGAEDESTEYVVDAVTGEILDTISKAHDAKVRKVYKWKKGSSLPGELVRQEGNPPTGDNDTDAAYDHTGTVYDFYSEFAERDSYGNKGEPIISTVHFTEPNGQPFENAYWNGEQMVFGAGYADSIDIVGHEFTHAVTEKTVELVPSGQSGALNESFSDIVGEVIEYYASGGTVDWKMGTNLPTGPFRSLKEPNEFSELAEAGINKPNPKKLTEWIVTCLDNFGIHINSTITSHAFYLAATKPGMEPLETGILFIEAWTKYLNVPNPTLEAARAAVLQAAKASFGEGSTQYKAVETAFNEVGLNGVAQPPALQDCAIQCSFQGALYKQRQSVTGDAALEMLSTLYKARGELAMTTVAGDHFLPLYEGHMERITELVTQDPVLAEMTVSGLEEVTPALEGLMEGEGEKFELTAEQMGKIEAALERLAEDDRLYAGENAGELADLIEHELRWLGLPSYAGMNYQSGFSRLNEETEGQMMMMEAGQIIEPNCLGKPYSNDFHVNAFYADSGTYTIPGQVSPINAGGIICGSVIEDSTGKSGCPGEKSLNTEVSVTLPPGDKVNSSKNLPSKAWAGKIVGRAFACAGDETQMIYGEGGLLSLSSWTESQCPLTAIACFEGKSTFNKGGTPVTGKGYAWVTESGGTLKLTTRPVTVSAEGYFATVGYGQFRVEMCARAGNSETKTCGGPTATWIHQNGNSAEPGCESGIGRFRMQAKNAAGESTVPVSTCVRWDKGAHMQTIDAPNSVTAVSCIPSSTTCVAGDSKGNALYSTNVSSSSASTWTSWTGPGVSPIHDVACPSSTLCLVAAGTVEGGGGNVYRASSLGGSFLSSFKPANGVGALSCPSTTFCVSAHEGGGFIRYTTNPSGIVWPAVTIGTGAMKDVHCLSSAFCAVVDAAGNVRVATSEAKVKEAAGWTATNVNSGVALRSVACSSTTSCIAVDGNNEVLKLTIAAGGGATVTTQTLAGAGELSDVTCTGTTCVATDQQGGTFTSSNSGTSWSRPYDAKGSLTSVSCASASLCAEPTTGGDIAKLDPIP